MEYKTKNHVTSFKPLQTDTKKSQDVSNSKVFQKSLRRREFPNANNCPKTDQPCKTNTQKARNCRRTKSKGCCHSNSKEDSKVVEDELTEVGSVAVHGSKKQNLNHLLNFYYTPREIQNDWVHGRINSYNKYNRWLPPVQLHKYNKEQFLQATCQFVVPADRDYSMYLNDPDLLVDWNLIEQIQIHSSEGLSCPICLCSPVAGKMTRCGHVYCWPCILHYLALSDKSWRKCPICYESISKDDLKSVLEITGNSLKVGDRISFNLMRRKKGTLIAVPVNSNESSLPQTFLSVTDKNCQQVHSKLLLAQYDDVMNIIQSEHVQLKMELSKDPDSLENCFIEQALQDLIVRGQQLSENVTTKLKNEIIEPISSDENIDVKIGENSASIKIDDVGIEKEFNSLDEEDDLNNINCHSHNDSQIITGIEENDPHKFHYFYQATDGRNVFLHAMNVKMLQMQYGHLEKSPEVICGELVEKEVGSITEDLRRRMRYLCHLPITSQFEIAEIDLQPPTVTEEILKYFEDQIISHKKKRKQKEKEERKREKKINEEENKRLGKYPIPNVQIESTKHFPQFQCETSEDNFSPSELVGVSSNASCSSPHSFNDIVPGVGNEGLSFAEMLRTNAAKNTVAWSSSSKKKVESSSSVNINGADIDFEMEEFMAPANSQSLGDALALALENSELIDQDNDSTGNLTVRTKKKKKKATILFATNMARTS